MFTTPNGGVVTVYADGTSRVTMVGPVTTSTGVRFPGVVDTDPWATGLTAWHDVLEHTGARPEDWFTVPVVTLNVVPEGALWSQKNQDVYLDAEGKITRIEEWYDFGPDPNSGLGWNLGSDPSEPIEDFTEPLSGARLSGGNWPDVGPADAELDAMFSGVAEVSGQGASGVTGLSEADDWSRQPYTGSSSEADDARLTGATNRTAADKSEGGSAESDESGEAGESAADRAKEDICFWCG